MRQTYIAVMVFPGRVARLAATANLDAYFRQASHRRGEFLPVAVFAMSPPRFMKAFGISRLPLDVELEWAADNLFRAPIDIRALPAVARHIRRLGGKTIPLLNAWRGAVDSALAA